MPPIILPLKSETFIWVLVLDFIFLGSIFFK